MKRESADKENGSADTVWPTVLKIDNSEEFQQSLAVAELAVRLCELKIAKPKTAPIEKENLDPKKFLEQAWELIQSARQQVLRPQTHAEYLIAHDGSHEAGKTVLERGWSASLVPFQEALRSETQGRRFRDDLRRALESVPILRREREAGSAGSRARV